VRAKKTTVKAVRFFFKHDDCIEEIANEIEDRRLSDFGSFLRGYDFRNEGLIARADFY